MLGTSAAGRPEKKMAHISPALHGTGGTCDPAVEHSDPSGRHPMPSSRQHCAALKGVMGGAHLSTTIPLTGPKSSKSDMQDATCSWQRLQNKEPSLARSFGVMHSAEQGMKQFRAGVSMRVAQARHVPTREGGDSCELKARQREPAPLAEQTDTEQRGRGEERRRHVPTRGWSAAGKPKEERTQVSPDGHGGPGTGATTKPPKEQGIGTLGSLEA